jgi:hypothetical protein
MRKKIFLLNEFLTLYNLVALVREFGLDGGEF